MQCSNGTRNRVKLTPNKCELFQRRVRFLGKMVTGEGYTMDPAETAPVKALKERTPIMVGELHQVLGFLSCYRIYTPNFSLDALPLYELLTIPHGDTIKPDPSLRKCKSTEKAKKGHLPSHIPIQWTSSH